MVFLCTVSAKINPTTRLWPRATPSTQVHHISKMIYNHSPCCFLTHNLFRSCHIFHNYRFRNVQQSWRKPERLHLCIGLLNWNIITCIVTLYYLQNATPWWSNYTTFSKSNFKQRGKIDIRLRRRKMKDWWISWSPSGCYTHFSLDVDDR